LDECMGERSIADLRERACGDHGALSGRPRRWPSLVGGQRAHRCEEAEREEAERELLSA